MNVNHIGIPTTTRFEGEVDLPNLKVTVSDHRSNPSAIQWQRNGQSIHVGAEHS